MEKKQYSDKEKLAYYQDKLEKLAVQIGFAQKRIAQLRAKVEDKSFSDQLVNARIEQEIDKAIAELEKA